MEKKLRLILYTGMLGLWLGICWLDRSMIPPQNPVAFPTFQKKSLQKVKPITTGRSEKKPLTIDFGMVERPVQNFGQLDRGRGKNFRLLNKELFSPSVALKKGTIFLKIQKDFQKGKGPLKYQEDKERARK